MKIIIKSCSYTLSEPYQPGPIILTQDEANALNAIRADRIRDNISKLSHFPKSNFPTFEEYNSVQILLSTKDQEYTRDRFKFDPITTRLSPMDRELLFLISEHPPAPTPLTSEGTPTKEMWEMARQRLLIKQSTLSSLEDLL